LNGFEELYLLIFTGLIRSGPFSFKHQAQQKGKNRYYTSCHLLNDLREKEPYQQQNGGAGNGEDKEHVNGTGWVVSHLCMVCETAAVFQRPK
jgi:hypothetical protein